MYMCIHCGHEFEEIAAKNYDRSTGTWEEYCPNCGSEDFEEAERCEICGEWKVADNITDGVCKECIEKAATKENAFLIGMEDKVKVEMNGFIAWAWKTFDMEMELLKGVTDADAREYALNDTWVVAQILKRRNKK